MTWKVWIAGVIGWLACSAGAEVTYRPVALTGPAALNHGLGPALGGDVEFAAFDQAVFGGDGTIAFQALLTGPDVTDADNIANFSVARAGTLTVLARAGAPNPAPNAGGTEVFVNLNGPVLNAPGNAFFLATVTRTDQVAAADDALFGTTGGTLATIARAGGAFAALSQPVVNASGTVIFRGTLAGDPDAADRDGIFAASDGTVSTIARTGPAGPGPGVGVGVTFDGFEGSPVVNAGGLIAFKAVLAGSGVSEANDRALFVSSGGAAPLAIARTGDAGTLGPHLAGASFEFLSAPTINAVGDVAFLGQLAGDDIGPANNRALFVRAGGTTAAIARSGATGPLGPDSGGDARFVDFGLPVINAAGAVAFNAAVVQGAGADERFSDGIFLRTGGGLSTVALTGTDAVGLGPGLGAGVEFSDFQAPLLDPGGALAFVAGLTGAGVDGANNLGLYVKADGTLELILRSGDVLDVDPTVGVDARTVRSFYLLSESGPEDGRPIAFLNGGTVVVGVDFTDNSSGVFEVAAPEPTSLALLGLAGIALLRRQR